MSLYSIINSGRIIAESFQQQLVDLTKQLEFQAPQQINTLRSQNLDTFAQTEVNWAGTESFIVEAQHSVANSQSAFAESGVDLMLLQAKEPLRYEIRGALPLFINNDDGDGLLNEGQLFGIEYKTRTEIGQSLDEFGTVHFSPVPEPAGLILILTLIMVPVWLFAFRLAKKLGARFLKS